VELDARGGRLRAALAAVLERADAPELRLVHAWLDSWAGPQLANYLRDWYVNYVRGASDRLHRPRRRRRWKCEPRAESVEEGLVNGGDWRVIMYRSVDSRRAGHIGRAERRRIKSLRARKRTARRLTETTRTPRCSTGWACTIVRGSVID
jgi:hypothetical protein